MKSIIDKLKKGFGIDTPPEAKPGTEQEIVEVQDKPASFIPVTLVKRETIIGFIIQSLKPYIDEKSMSVAGLRLYVLCTDREQEEAARVALYMDKPGMFKTEHLDRKLADHFIQLEADWFFEYSLVKDQLPGDSLQKDHLALQVIRAGDRVVNHQSRARVQVLMGQGAQSEYELDPATKQKFHIGRSRSPQLSSGKIQLNDIVFLGNDEPGFDEAAGHRNLHVSRNHAYIVYDPKTDRYLLYPDTGGLPENGNKVKVHTADDKTKWLNIYGVAHILQDGDQVELGGEAVLRFEVAR
jgi:hypothetical protein